MNVTSGWTDTQNLLSVLWWPAAVVFIVQPSEATVGQTMQHVNSLGGKSYVCYV